LNVLKSKPLPGSLEKMIPGKNTCARHTLVTSFKKNTCAGFLCFLFVIFLQTGNFLSAQVDHHKDSLSVKTDSTHQKKTPKIHKPTIPWKAALMSGLVPGLGQIYNRKYWKLPIVWGALGVTGYFLVDQQIKYVQFRDAYRSWANDSIILPGYEQYAYNPSGLRSERDTYERSRNVLCIVAAVLWTLNIVDAAVDAHLSTFDVGPNLSMKIQPATFFNTYQNQPAVGLSFTFTLK
jgi:hypothetical protein